MAVKPPEKPTPATFGRELERLVRENPKESRDRVADNERRLRSQLPPGTSSKILTTRISW